MGSQTRTQRLTGQLLSVLCLVLAFSKSEVFKQVFHLRLAKLFILLIFAGLNQWKKSIKL